MNGSYKMDPVAVIVNFNENKAVPLKFRHQGTVYDITRVINQQLGRNVWGQNSNQIFTVELANGKTAKMEWVVDTGEWLLIKMPAD